MGNVIKYLSETTISKISAGEVVERPLSVVKELVENAIDSGASFIKVELENGGKNLISITDNGSGMTLSDLEICTEKHTTSKLDESDIMSIKHLGFRGEALNSIASVAKLVIRTKQSSIEHGYQLEYIQKKKISKIICNNGTQLIVKDLFYSIPARLRFLKSDLYEFHLIRDYIKQIAVCKTKVVFELLHNNKKIINISSHDILERSKILLGNSNKLHPLNDSNKHENISISGFLSESRDFTSKKEFIFFVNTRLVKDKLLIASVKYIYKKLNITNPFSILLFISIPVEEIDVNVHPAKTEVRFRNSNSIKNAITDVIEETLIPLVEKISVDNHVNNNLRNDVVQDISISQEYNFKQNTESINNSHLNERNYSSQYNYPSSFDNVTVVTSEPKHHNNNNPHAHTTNLNLPPQPSNTDRNNAILNIHERYSIVRYTNNLYLLDNEKYMRNVLYKDLINNNYSNEQKTYRIDIDSRINEQNIKTLKTIGIKIINSDKSIIITTGIKYITDDFLKKLINRVQEKILKKIELVNFVVNHLNIIKTIESKTLESVYQNIKYLIEEKILTLIDKNRLIIEENDV